MMNTKHKSLPQTEKSQAPTVTVWMNHMLVWLEENNQDRMVITAFKFAGQNILKDNKLYQDTKNYLLPNQSTII